MAQEDLASFREEQDMRELVEAELTGELK
jgi:hypothetical protein